MLILQTALPPSNNLGCCNCHQYILIKYFLFLLCDNVYHAEGHTKVAVSVNKSCKKKLSEILMKITCHGFFQHWWIPQVATLAAPSGFILKFYPDLEKNFYSWTLKLREKKFGGKKRVKGDIGNAILNT